MDFHQVNVFLEVEKVQCHLKSEHLLCSRVKLDKKNDEAGYRIPMKATLVQHLHAMFTWKQKYGQSSVLWNQMTKKKDISVQVQHLGIDQAKNTFSKIHFLCSSWEQPLRTAEVTEVLKDVLKLATKSMFRTFVILKNNWIPFYFEWFVEEGSY